MTSRMEACPNVAMEAMSHSCLCISTESPPMPEFFGDSSWYYSPRDASALAEQIRETDLLSNEEKSIMKEYAKNRAAYFTWEKCVELTIELFSKCSR